MCIRDRVKGDFTPRTQAWVNVLEQAKNTFFTREERIFTKKEPVAFADTLPIP